MGEEVRGNEKIVRKKRKHIKIIIVRKHFGAFLGAFSKMLGHLEANRWQMPRVLPLKNPEPHAN